MGSNPSYFKGSKRPVENVSWDDCQKFISKLNDLTGANFRLPTSYEWEFAAKGGNSSRGYKYSGSDTMDDVAWYGENGGCETHKVGGKSPNELGIYDMSGNVEEWSSTFSNSKRWNGYMVHGESAGRATVRMVHFRTASRPDHREAYLGLRLCH